MNNLSLDWKILLHRRGAMVTFITEQLIRKKKEKKINTYDYFKTATRIDFIQEVLNDFEPMLFCQ